MPKDFFTPASFASLIGLSGITYVVSSVVQQVFDFSPKWFALAVAIAATELGVVLTGAHDWVLYILGALNGFLVYLTAVGGNAATSRAKSGAAALGIGARSVRKRRFSDSWF